MSADQEQAQNESKGCVLFLLDQSISMAAAFAGGSQKKSEIASNLINQWMQQLIAEADAADPSNDSIDIGVLGYCTDRLGNPLIESLLSDLSRDTLFPITQVAAARTLRQQDSYRWVTGKAEGNSPQCDAMYAAHGVLREWLGDNPSGHPPFVVHVVGGESFDGNPMPYAKSLQNLRTAEGHVLLFQCLLSNDGAKLHFCPSDDVALGNEAARNVFRMSSELPEYIFDQLNAAGYGLHKGARGFAVNSDLFGPMLSPPSDGGDEPPDSEFDPPLSNDDSDEALDEDGDGDFESDEAGFDLADDKTVSDYEHELIDVISVDDQAIRDSDVPIEVEECGADELTELTGDTVLSIDRPNDFTEVELDELSADTDISIRTRPLQASSVPLSDPPQLIQHEIESEEYNLDDHEALEIEPVDADDEEQIPIEEELGSAPPSLVVNLSEIDPVSDLTVDENGSEDVVLDLDDDMFSDETDSGLSFIQQANAEASQPVDEIFPAANMEGFSSEPPQTEYETPVALEEFDSPGNDQVIDFPGSANDARIGVEVAASTVTGAADHPRDLPPRRGARTMRVAGATVKVSFSFALALVAGALGTYLWMQQQSGSTGATLASRFNNLDGARNASAANIENAVPPPPAVNMTNSESTDKIGGPGQDTAESTVAFSPDAAPPLLNDTTNNVIETSPEDDSALDPLTAAIGSAVAYRRALQDQLDQNPDSPRSTDIERVLEEDVPTVDALAAWNLMLADWAKLDMRALNADQATSMLQLAEQRLVQFSEIPGSTALRRRLPALKAIVERNNELGASISAQLVAMFNRSDATVPFVLKTKSGDTYFLPEAPNRENGKLTFEYVIDLELIREQTQISATELDKVASGLLSHEEIARKATSLLAQMRDENWESTFFRIARSIYLAQKMDPIVKLCWLKKTLVIACQGSHPMQQAFDEHLALLSSVDVPDATNWCNYTDPDVEKIRTECAQLLEKLPDLDSPATAAARNYNSLATFPHDEELLWIGWLSRSTGEWTVEVAPRVGASGKLAVASQISDGRFVIEVVGLIDAGRSTVQTENGQELLFETRPVFLVPED